VSLSSLVVATLNLSASAVAVPSLFTAVAILALGLAVLVRGRSSIASQTFFGICAGAAGWLGCYARCYVAVDPVIALEWARFGTFFIGLIAPSMFHFTVVYCGRERVLRRFVIASWVLCLGSSVVAASYGTQRVILYSWGFFPAESPFDPFWGGLFLTIVIASIVMLVRAWREASGESRKRTRALTIAFVVAALAFADFAPSAGIDVPPMGFLAMFAFVVVVSHAVWRYQLVDLTPEYAAGQILATMKGAVIVVDLAAKIRVVNRAAAHMLGYGDGELAGQHLKVIFESSDTLNTGQLLHSLGVLENNMRWLTKAGAAIDVSASSSFVRDEAGMPVGVVYVATDVTERLRAEEALRESERRYRLLFERNLAGVYRTRVDGRILDCNEALARMFGYASRDELLAASAVSMYFSAEDRERLLTRLREEHTLSNIETRLRRRDGSEMWALENMTLLGDGIMEGTLIDITERKSVQQQMEYQAYHDVLTSLPNRLLFRDRITVALAHARRAKRSAAVMFLDLDQFKLVNDTLGHTVGDRLLQEAGGRIMNCVRSEDTVARMGGDEFTILLPDIADGHAAATVAQKVLEAFSHPTVVDGHELFVTTSIGIAIFSDDGADAETLLKNADRAMYRAKEAGRNNYQFATPSAFDAGRLSLERSMHHAFEREEFVVHYQPMIDLVRDRVVGAEALIRWNHPEHGLMLPDDFIPVAEDCGLIFPIGEWVLRTACRQMKRWHDAGHSKLRVAVNLSARQFQQRELASVIERVLGETSFPAAMLDVEITESAAMQNAELSLTIMKRLKEMGVRISIDDFGTGYSSLSYLKRFPIDTVKIDQGFVRDLGAGSSDGAIISAVISMARALKLHVVAEGVETEEQLAFLQREQCAEIQGFLFSRPVSAEEFEATLARV
jgi:diguanylate cyclase (GGDEF)-like protein/PAS domain S-box-containing protein